MTSVHVTHYGSTENLAITEAIGQAEPVRDRLCVEARPK
jgi:hypothetical protein